MKTLPLAVKLFLAFSFMLLCGKAYSQTNTFPTTGAAGIGTLTPNASSLLDVTSTTQGVLVPRMTKTQRDAIVAPVTGLLIYQTNSSPGFYNYTGSEWTAVTPKAGANKFLDNLKEPTAVNVELLPATDNTINLGSTTSSWKDLYLDGSVYLGGSRFIVKNCGSGSFNTAIGEDALYSNTTGYFNAASGHQALYSNTTGYSNTAIGYAALYSNTTGGENTASGNYALYSNTTGIKNTASGYLSLNFNTTGSENTAIGQSALYSNTTGEENTASGNNALYSNTTGWFNTASGYGALYSNTTGSGNTACGLYTGSSNTIGSENSFFGSLAGQNTTTTGNTMIGYMAGNDNTTGSANTVVGRNSLSSSTASNCTVIGNEAGNNFTPGDNCTLLGYDADVTADGFTNSTAIGNGALVSTSNNFRFGNSSVIGWGFGVAASTRAIKVGTGATNGNGAYLTVGGTWTDVSDINKKENITELDKNSILEKIQQLKVSKWMYTGTKDEYHIGPMAAEFHKLFEVGDDSSISSMDKTGVLFLGLQALSEEDGRLKTEDVRQNSELENLKKENENLKAEIESIKSDLSRFNWEIQNPNSEMISGFAKFETQNPKPETLLGQNIPNPFDNSTLIPFRIPKNCHHEYFFG